MSPAFMIFVVWLALALGSSRFVGGRRHLARMALLLAAPGMLIVAYATQGWFPAMLVALSVLTVFGGEFLSVLRGAGTLLTERRVRRSA